MEVVAEIRLLPAQTRCTGETSMAFTLRQRRLQKIPFAMLPMAFLSRHASPRGPRKVAEDRMANLRGILDAFFSATGYHMNVNVINREMLLNAMDHPEKYPHLTIRVSGYAVNFVRLTREQQMDVISRTFHGRQATT